LDNALGPAIAPPAEKDPEDPPFRTFATRLEILRNCAEFLDVVQASDKDVVERPAIEAVALNEDRCGRLAAREDCAALAAGAPA
jgi:hypothetical protein